MKSQETAAGRRRRRDKPQLTPPQRDLIRRYLIWCYKTTKEDLDRVDRYFTQAMVDDFLIQRLTALKEYASAGLEEPFRKSVDEFITYARQKKENAQKKKFTDETKSALHPGYHYLTARLAAVEEAVIRFLGPKELAAITALYEKEMTVRILQAREHG